VLRRRRARGLRFHIGWFRRQSARDPVDVAGGTSMGAFLSALLACGLDSVEMARHAARETFVKGNYPERLSVPRCQLIAGESFSPPEKVFGDRTIEDLRRTYFCVSSKSPSGAKAVHDRGPLATWVGTSMALPGLAPADCVRGRALVRRRAGRQSADRVHAEPGARSDHRLQRQHRGDIRAAGTGVGKPDPLALLEWKGTGGPPGLREITAGARGALTATRRCASGRARRHLHPHAAPGHPHVRLAPTHELIDRATSTRSPRSRRCGTNSSADPPSTKCSPSPYTSARRAILVQRSAVHLDVSRHHVGELLLLGARQAPDDVEERFPLLAHERRSRRALQRSTRQPSADRAEARSASRRP